MAAKRKNQKQENPQKGTNYRRLESLTNSLLQFNEAQLINEAELGKSNAFRMMEGRVAPIQMVATMLRECSFEGVHDNVLEPLASAAEQVVGALQTIKAFKVEPPQEQREQSITDRQKGLIDQLVKRVDNFQLITMRYIGFGAQHPVARKKRDEERNKEFVSHVSQIQNYLKQVRGLASRFEQLQGQWNEHKASLDAGWVEQNQTFNDKMNALQSEWKQTKQESKQRIAGLQEAQNRERASLRTELDEIRSELDQQISKKMDRAIAEGREGFEALLNSATEMQKTIAAAEKEAKRKLDTINADAVKAAMAEHAMVFCKTADDHKWKGYGWLAAAAIVTGLTVRYLFAASSSLLEFHSPTAGAGWALLAAGLAHLSILSVGYTAILFTARTFRGHLHNQTVNRLKANALSTFQIFVDSDAATDEAKQAVLLAATRAIYESRPTGFSEKGVEFTGHPLAADVANFVAAARDKK